MSYGLVVINGPAVEPVTLAVAKTHLRIDHDAEDTLIAAWIAAARKLTEEYTGRRWIEQGLRLTLAGFPCPSDTDYDCGRIRLPVQPVTSIDAVSYVDAAGDEETLTEGDGYQTWLDHNPPLLAPAVNGAWPLTQAGAIRAVTIEFTAGGELADVPEQVKTAILLTLGDWDKNRAGEGTVGPRGAAGSGIPVAAQALLDTLWTGAY